MSGGRKGRGSEGIRVNAMTAPGKRKEVMTLGREERRLAERRGATHGYGGTRGKRIEWRGGWRGHD